MAFKNSLIAVAPPIITASILSFFTSISTISVALLFVKTTVGFSDFTCSCVVSTAVVHSLPIITAFIFCKCLLNLGCIPIDRLKIINEVGRLLIILSMACITFCDFFTSLSPFVLRPQTYLSPTLSKLIHQSFTLRHFQNILFC